MQSNDNNRLNDVISSAIKNLSMITDVNTIIGEPIIGNNGEYILPFSKVTLGVIVGGGEYGKVSLFKKGKDLPYSAGNGAIVSIKPCGFLIKNNLDDDFKFVNLGDSTFDKIYNKVMDWVEKNNEKNN